MGGALRGLSELQVVVDAEVLRVRKVAKDARAEVD
jgi:hypothetical protein